MKDIQSLVRPNIRKLCPYSTARDEFSGTLGVFLDANESPYQTGWNRYPDPRQKVLKQRISEIKGVRPECIFLGNGSDEAIDLVFRIFCEPGKDNVVCISPSYGMYAVSADINDIELREVRLGENFSLPTEALLSCCDAHTKAMFLCSPNNPSGNAFPNAAIEEILMRFNGMVIVDEAYIDFCSVPSLTAKIDSYPNLIILQTMSKARGLAALRLGMAFTQPYTATLMSMVKYPYNINASTQSIALDMLSRDISGEVREIVSERKRVASELTKFSCVKKIYPSEANFILAEVDDADRLYGHFIADGIIVRNRTNAPMCRNCLRVTIGLREENDSMLKSLSRYEESYIRG